MALLNKIFKKPRKEDAPAKKEAAKKPAKPKKEPAKIAVAETEKPEAQKPEAKKPAVEVVRESQAGIFISPHTAEKAIAAQRLNKYVFKVGPKADKISIAREAKKKYGVKVLSVNIVNLPAKIRRIGKTSGYKSGYKKAIITLAEGQTIEFKNK